MSTIPHIPEVPSPHPGHESPSIKSVQEGASSQNTIPDTPQLRGSPTSLTPADPATADPATAALGEPIKHSETCLEYAQKHIKKEVDTWKDEIASLLLFATLFAGVAGTFAIESYHNVTQDPADTTVLLLKTLVALQLNATNPQPGLSIDLNPQSPISAAARRINIYNFVSLILSLVVVVVGIVCLQWLREYGQDTSAVPVSRQGQIGVCRMRSDGMEKWRVFGILKVLPVILLLSLLVFFIGIIELLLEADIDAAIVASVIILLAYLFLATTTVLPTLQIVITQLLWQNKFSQCPYKSPQAWIFYQFVTVPIRIVNYVRRLLRRTPFTRSGMKNWPEYDHLLYMNFARLEPTRFHVMSGVYWLGNMYLHEERLADAVYECLKSYVRTALSGALYGGFYRFFCETFYVPVATPAAAATPSVAPAATVPISPVSAVDTSNSQSTPPIVRAATAVTTLANTQTTTVSADSPVVNWATALADLPPDAPDSVLTSILRNVVANTAPVDMSIALSAAATFALWIVASEDPLSHTLAHTDPRRANSLKRALVWAPPDGTSFTHKAHIFDVVLFQTLAHLVEKIERGQNSAVLLRRRLELFVKICRTRLDQDIDCPLAIMATSIPIPYTMHQDVFQCILDLMQNADVNETHMNAVLGILTMEIDKPTPNIQLFDDALQAVESWMKRRSPDLNLRDKPINERLPMEGEMLDLQAEIERIREYVSPEGARFFWREIMQDVNESI